MEKFPFGHWKLLQNQKEFIASLASRYNIKHPSEWGKITARNIRKEKGGHAMINRYKGSMYKLLKSVLPDVEWKEDWFKVKRNPSGFLLKRQNRRKMMDEIAARNKFTSPNDWLNVSFAKFMSENGGSGLLKYYKGSPLKCLQDVYPEVNWKIDSFSKRPNSYWTTVANQQTFIFDLSKKLNVKSSKDWKKINTKAIRRSSGKGLLKLYDNSISKLLKSVFPENNWDEDSFSKLPQSYWKLKANQRIFLDSIAEKLSIKTPKQWSEVDLRKIRELGGNSLLSIYGSSLFKALQSVYSEIEWKREWFPKIPKYPASYWMSKKNQLDFLDSIAIDYKIKEPSDWARLTISLIRKKGGQGLLSIHGNSLSRVISSLYNHSNNWEKDNKWNSSVSQQKLMRIVL